MKRLADSFAALEAQAACWDEAEAPGSVRIHGEDYEAAVDVGPITPEWDEQTMTTRLVQKAQVRVRRCLLDSAPSAGARIVLDGLEWFIERLGEQHKDALVWALHLKRIVAKGVPS